MPVAVRPLTSDQLDDAERVFRLAFGTFLGLREPLRFTGDCAYVRTRWLADPSAAWGAHLDDALAGSNFATRWGSFAFFGPLSVRPEWWERGIARHLWMRRCSASRRGRAYGPLPFAQSPKHVALYQRYGFFPQYLTAIASKNVVAAAGAVTPDECRSALVSTHRAATLRECAELTDAIFAGLDVTREIDAVQEQALGDTLLLRDDGALRGFAVCHLGPGTEAGGGVCYVKFAAVAPGAGAATHFERLLALCERYAALRGAAQIVAGVNTARAPAYQALLANGYRSYAQGVAMQCPNDPGFNRPDVWILDDWR